MGAGQGYQGVSEAREGIGAYLRFYNEGRPHQALGYRTPREVFESRETLAGEAEHTEGTIVAWQEPERRCFRNADVISYLWSDPSPRVMATSGMAGDSLYPALYLSKLLGPLQIMKVGKLSISPRLTTY